jgi:hypothetical protein
VYASCPALHLYPVERNGATMKNISKYANVKADKDDTSTMVLITVDMSNLDDADVLEFATQTLIIKAQAAIRKLKVIPSEYTYKPGKPGTRATETVDSLWAKMDDTERAEFLAKYNK